VDLSSFLNENYNETPKILRAAELGRHYVVMNIRSLNKITIIIRETMTYQTNIIFIIYYLWNSYNMYKVNI